MKKMLSLLTVTALFAQSADMQAMDTARQYYGRAKAAVGRYVALAVIKRKGFQSVTKGAVSAAALVLRGTEYYEKVQRLYRNAILDSEALIL